MLMSKNKVTNMNNNDLRKICRTCLEELSIDCFPKGRKDYRERGLPSGWHPDCKNCIAEKKEKLRSVRANRTQKTCNKCKKTKSIDFFSTIPSRKDRLGNMSYRSNCKSCDRKYFNERYANDPNAQYYKMIKYRYDISKDELLMMIKNQNNKCKICNTEFTNNKPNIDHCHNTGKVRGLLCSKCNNGIGQFNDDIELLKEAINYLSQ